MPQQLKRAYLQMLRQFGETFTCTRAGETHEIRGLHDPAKGTIGFPAESDLLPDDQLTSNASKAEFVVTTVTPQVANDIVMYTEARYETAQQRMRRLAAEQRQIPSVTIGTVQGSILNLTSQLHNVTQTINMLPNSSQADKEALTTLMRQLSDVLRDAPVTHAEEAETVTERAEALAKEARKAKPDHGYLTVSADGLKKAATNLAVVLPAVVPIAIQLADQLLKAAQR